MKKGQALVVLLVFVTMALAITSAAVLIMINNSEASSALEQSIAAKSVAEAGIENALLRLLRDPTYSGETLTIGDGVATITVTGSSPVTIVSQGQLGSYLRELEVMAEYDGGVLSVQTWQEVY